jgi:hypothetical protein
MSRLWRSTCRDVLVGYDRVTGQIIREQLAAAGQFGRVLNDFGLLLRREVVHFLNDFCGGHEAKIIPRHCSDKFQSVHRYDRPGQRPAPRRIHTRNELEYA